jgi:hypothetical protein
MDNQRRSSSNYNLGLKIPSFQKQSENRPTDNSLYRVQFPDQSILFIAIF